VSAAENALISLNNKARGNASFVVQAPAMAFANLPYRG
jgi:hypothetical protein